MLQLLNSVLTQAKSSALSSGIKLEGSNTAQALELISQIFAADKSLEGLPDKEKLKAKQEKVKPLPDKYWSLLENMNPRGDSGLKKAIAYSLNQRINLNVFAYLTYFPTELPKLGEAPTPTKLDSPLPWSSPLPEYCK